MDGHQFFGRSKPCLKQNARQDLFPTGVFYSIEISFSRGAFVLSSCGHRNASWRRADHC